jgi:Tfp pilus assembly protein PilO
VDKFFEFAPIIIVVLAFMSAYKVFVTPAQMKDEFMCFERALEEKFVLKETHSVTINEMKSDIEEIKNKLDKIYNKLMDIS